MRGILSGRAVDCIGITVTSQRAKVSHYSIVPNKSKDQLETQWKILLADLRDGIGSQM